MKFYHGTTIENAINILNGGEKNNPVWNCSYDDYLYVWSAQAIKESDGLEDDEVNYFCLNRAFESAQITAASNPTPQKELVVLVFDFPEADVYEDFSCDNMDCARRVTGLDGTDLEQSLLEIWIHPHNSRLDAFVISGLLDNKYFISDSIEGDLLSAAKQIRENEIFLDELYTFDYAEKKDKNYLTIPENMLVS